MLPPLPSVIPATSTGESLAWLHNNCFFGSGLILPAPQQRMAHAWHSIGTWHGLLMAPGKRSMCSQAFLGVPCLLSQQHIRSAPRNSWQEQSLDHKLWALPVSKSSWAWLVPELGTGLPVCVCGCGGEKQPRGKPNKTALKSLGTSLHRQGFVDCMWWSLDIFFTENIFSLVPAHHMAASVSSHQSTGVGMKEKKAMGYFHSVCPPALPLSISLQFHITTASRAFSWIVSYFLVYLPKNAFTFPQAWTALTAISVSCYMALENPWNTLQHGKKQMKNDCVREGGKGQSAEHYPEKTLFC